MSEPHPTKTPAGAPGTGNPGPAVSTPKGIGVYDRPSKLKLLLSWKGLVLLAVLVLLSFFMIRILI